MCRRCSAPDHKFIVHDNLTGHLFCEECGFAVRDLSWSAYAKGSYIWELNPNWPPFTGFQDLLRQVTEDGRISLPPCRPVPNLPSRLLTSCLERLGGGDI